jgi:hypothetical protein
MIGWRSGQSPTCAVIFAVAGIICAALLSTPCWAGPTGTAQALEAFTITNPDPTLTATDFHLKVQSLSPAFLLFGTENLDVTGTTGPAGSTAVAQGSGTPTITVDWTGLAIGSGKSTIFGLSTVQMHNKVGITDAFWTYPGGSTIGVEIPGFGVFTDPQYFIGNDFTDPIGIRGLQFLVNVPEIPLDTIGSPPKGQTHLKLKNDDVNLGRTVMRFARLWVSEVASQSPEGSLNLQETDRVSPVFRLSVRGGLGKARIP